VVPTYFIAIDAEAVRIRKESRLLAKSINRIFGILRRRIHPDELHVLGPVIEIATVLNNINIRHGLASSV
jgi:hypothetical protein